MLHKLRNSSDAKKKRAILLFSFVVIAVIFAAWFLSFQTKLHEVSKEMEIRKESQEASPFDAFGKQMESLIDGFSLEE